MPRPGIPASHVSHVVASTKRLIGFGTIVVVSGKVGVMPLCEIARAAFKGSNERGDRVGDGRGLRQRKSLLSCFATHPIFDESEEQILWRLALALGARRQFAVQRLRQLDRVAHAHTPLQQNGSQGTEPLSGTPLLTRRLWPAARSGRLMYHQPAGQCTWAGGVTGKALRTEKE